MFLKLVICSLLIAVALIVICRRVAKRKNSETALRSIVYAGVIAIGLMWWGLYDGGSKPKLERKPVNTSALTTYSIEQFPRFYANWGEDGIKRIEARERVALDVVSQQANCDSVYWIGLAEKQSTPPDNIVIFANCENNYQFYVGPGGNILSYRKTN